LKKTAIHKINHLNAGRYLWIAMLIISQMTISTLIFGQHGSLDSLKAALKNKNLNKAQRTRLLIDIGNQLTIADSMEARRYFTKAGTLASQLNNNYLKGRVYNGIGNIYYHYKHLDSALIFYQKAGQAYASSDSKYAKQSAAMNQANIANLLIHNGQYEEAVNTFLSGITLMMNSDAENKWEAIGSLYNGIATAYYDFGQKDKALFYDLKSLAAFRNYHNSQMTAIAELTVAGDYVILGNLDSTRIHLHAAEKIIRKEHLTELYYKLDIAYGQLYRKLKQPGQAIDYFQSALAYARSPQGTSFQLMNVLRLLGFAQRDNANYAASAKYLKESLTLIRKLGLKKLEIETLQKLGDVYLLLNRNRMAANYYHQYIILNDSLQTAETKIKINEIENRYQAKQKADSINVLKQNAALQQLALLKKRNQNYFITISASLLFLLGILLYRNLINKHRLLKKNEIIYQQEIKHLENERQLIGAQSLMKGQEEERSRLAKDLHDGVGGLLSGVKLSLNYMKGNVFLTEKNALALNTVIDQLDVSINELRRVSHNMMPEALIKFGLKEAVENYCESINQTGALKIRLQTYGFEQRFEQDTETILFRMIQELLNNIVKHAQAQQALVQLIKENSKLSLTVEDDGKGFEKSSLDATTGAGFANIIARAAFLNCSVEIRTAPGEGTSITIEGTIA